MKRSKKYLEAAAKVKQDHLYTPLEAVTLAKETTTTKYDSTIEVALVLGVDPKKADQAIRSTCLLYTSPSPRDGLLSRMPSSA